MSPDARFPLILVENFRNTLLPMALRFLTEKLSTGPVSQSCVGAADSFRRRASWRWPLGLGLAVILPTVALLGSEPQLDVFKNEIQPILEEYCYDCHGNGFKKGGVQLDGFETEAALHDHKLW